MAKFKVDFSGVEDSRGTEIAPGKYNARVEKVTKEEGTKAPYLAWELKITSGSAKGLHITHRTSLSPKALFGLRDTLEAFGVKVPKAAVSIDPDKFIGKSLGISVVMKPYEGKDYPNIKSVFGLGEIPEVVATDSDEDLPFGASDEDEISIDLD